MKILDFPEVRQAYDYDCGAAAIESILEYYGFNVPESKIIKQAGTTKSGTHPKRVATTFKRYKLKHKSGVFTIDKLKKYLDKKIPVILLIQAWTDKKKINWEKDWTDGHYVIAIGYDSKRIYFSDPYSIIKDYLSYNELEKRWHDKISKKVNYINYGIAVYGKKPNFNLKKAIKMK